MVNSSVKRITQVLAASFALSVTAGLSGCGSDTATNTDIESVDVTSPVTDWQMVWNDEFDGASIDASKWTHEVNCDGGGNQEQQCYTDSADNSFVADGILNIVAMPAEEGSPLPYTSARMVTKNQGDWTYGRFEMRAKLPQGRGSWPAFWMLSTDEVYGGWPKSGEIDIVESVNLNSQTEAGDTQANIFGTLHYGRDFPNNDSSGQAYVLPDGVNPADDFHTYSIEWQEGEIRWYIDDYLYATQLQSELRINSKGEAVGLKHKGWYAEFFDAGTGELETQWNTTPFDQDFHLILNFAVGGSFPNGLDSRGIDPTAFEGGQAFQIDYVRVYECSQDPTTGRGCESVRENYKTEKSEAIPDGALVIGKAPNPPPPSTGIAVPLTIFEEAINPAWPAWDCCGGTTPEVVMDDADHNNVVEFRIENNNGTVLGFNTAEAESPIGFNASPMLNTGSVTFDMKVITQPTTVATPNWLFKIESNSTSEAVEIPLSTSQEGVDPVTGEWQTYTFSLKSLADAGLDLSNIDVLMIFPAWQTGEGAVYRVDNVKISEGGDVTFPELVLFEDQANPDWPLWDCCGGTTPTEEMDDADHGVVAEFSILDNNGTVLGFKPPDDSGISFDASALLSVGVIQFEMKMVSAPTDSSSVWKFKVESNGATEAVELDLATGNNGNAPVAGEWATYTFTLSSLADAGLDLSAIDVLMIFPAWQTGEGAVYRVDNAKIFNPNSDQGGGNGGGSGPIDWNEADHVIFTDSELADWALWDCCGGTMPTVETDEEFGSVAQFTIPGNGATVQGFNGRENNGVIDASDLAANGIFRFDLKVNNQGTSSLDNWVLKIESGSDQSFVEVNLDTNKDGNAVTVGSWQSFTFDLSTLTNSTSLDLSAIDIIMIFPAWETGSGAEYQVDNVVITAPLDGGGVEPPRDWNNSDNVVFTDAEVATWALWDCCGGTMPTVETDAEFGSVAQFTIPGNGATVQGFNGRENGGVIDASSIAANGIFRFDLKVNNQGASSLDNWLLKIESGSDQSFVEVNLTTNKDGNTPTVGSWQSFTFDLSTLSDGTSLDLSAIDIIMIFPAWETGSGAEYQVDNVVITAN